MQQVALRLKRFGADLAYIDMDEPLWFGHFYNGVGTQQSCHNPMSEVARQTAVKMREVRQIYPQVLIGEDEPVGVPDAIAPNWPEDIREWLEAYRTAMGEPMGFFHADMVWQRRGWQAILLRVEAVVRQERVSFGLIYNGTPSNPTDASWIDDAVRHFEEVEGALHIRPDQAMLQSWMDHPRAMLPETDPSALTNLVLRYSGWLKRR